MWKPIFWSVYIFIMMFCFFILQSKMSKWIYKHSNKLAFTSYSSFILSDILTMYLFICRHMCLSTKKKLYCYFVENFKRNVSLQWCYNISKRCISNINTKQLKLCNTSYISQNSLNFDWSGLLYSISTPTLYNTKVGFMSKYLMIIITIKFSMFHGNHFLLHFFICL